MAAEARFWAERAWVGARWRERVLLVARDGHWTSVAPDVPQPEDAERIAGPALPSLVDAHSHAFQRAFAGLAERRDGSGDNFWSWRDRMYGLALRITPEQLRAVAAALYGELLAGGYTQVCEFHYLQHRPDGERYADPSAMSQALADAAAEAGIGLTLLPVLYERAGFAQPALRTDQRRFATTVADVRALQRAARGPLVNAGVAVHSLRAARAESIEALAEAAVEGPIHIHVSEQQAEVHECIASTGLRPVEWLARRGLLDRRWQLVHATHTEPRELDDIAASGAGVVLCPGTEANLGDGLPDLPGLLGRGIPIAIGSDSQVTRAWPEELRWLEYGQRLRLRRRNVAADPEGGEASTAARLFARAQAAGGAAAGFAHWGLEVGARADLLELNPRAEGLCGLPDSHLLDGLVFASAGAAFSRVMVAGRWVGPRTERARFEAVMRSLWQEHAGMDEAAEGNASG